MPNEHAAIKHLLATYCHRVDRGTAAEVAELFAEDAVLMPYYDGRYDVHGRAGIRGWYAFYHQTLGTTVKHLKHLVNSIMIDAEGDAATSVSYLTAYFVTLNDNTAYQVQGTYFDTLVCIEENWLFQTRRIEVEFMTPLGKVIDRMEPMGFPRAGS